MVLTAHSDLFGSVNEDAFNKIIRHVMRKRPSLFNYGTQWVAEHWREVLCEPPDVAREVRRRRNPVVTIEPAIPLLGTGGGYGLNFGVQLRELSIDFHPQSRALPPELGPLAEQRFALAARACAGIGCPGERSLEQFPPAPQPPIRLVDDRERPKDAEVQRFVPTIVLPTERLSCCCLELYIVGHFAVTGPPGDEVLEMKLDNLEIVDVEPECLEANLECYLKLLMHYVVLPRLRVLMPVFVFGILDGLATITLKPANTVPFNPAVEQDQLKVFVDVEVGP